MCGSSNPKKEKAAAELFAQLSKDATLQPVVLVHGHLENVKRELRLRLERMREGKQRSSLTVLNSDHFSKLLPTKNPTLVSRDLMIEVVQQIGHAGVIADPVWPQQDLHGSGSANVFSMAGSSILSDQLSNKSTMATIEGSVLIRSGHRNQTTGTPSGSKDDQQHP
ncbi:hypothetical protein ACLOJK_023844 [Asimina triloba]